MLYYTGFNLPKGTPVYTRSYSTNMHVYHLIDHKTYYSHNKYRLEDGIWATDAARKFWNKNPQLHPHVTLFQIIYNKEKLQL